ncbi:uncharacterized protein LOC141654886 [Silene latifolia]|uniref:uncharacterized protein LOC141654886 n=1 Tax=Silene latifolia TaxID=37657 RepID=UPI003D779EDC
MTKDSGKSLSPSSASTTISPYFLSTSDKLGDKVIQVLLNGDNYDEWSVKFRGAMRTRKKTGFLDGSIKKPADSSDDLEDWYMVNAMIVNWIFNVIEPSLGSSITYVDEAKTLWDDIEQRFSVGNGPKLHRVKTSISMCKQGEKEAVSDYFGRFKHLWDERDKYDREPSCDCGGCKCRINKKLEKKRDESKRREFLMGLDSKYSTVRFNLLLQEPLTSLNKVYATVIQEEGVRGDNGGGTTGGRGEGHSDPIGFSARSNNMGGTNRLSGDKESESSWSRCDKCNRWGYARAKCFDIIGYPSGWRERGKQSSDNNFNTEEVAVVAVEQVAALVQSGQM